LKIILDKNVGSLVSKAPLLPCKNCFWFLPEELADISSYQTLPADKMQKVINLEQSSSKKLAHICANSG
jgi:hypothetical protein